MNSPAPVRHFLNLPIHNPAWNFTETRGQLYHPVSGHHLTDIATSSSSFASQSPGPRGGHTMASLSSLSMDQLCPSDPYYTLCSAVELPDQPLIDGVTYVNPKQFRIIMKRRQVRAKLQEDGRIPKTRNKTYLHESRHNHCKTRIRSATGAFASVENQPLFANVKADPPLVSVKTRLPSVYGKTGPSGTADVPAQTMRAPEEAGRRWTFEEIRQEPRLKVVVKKERGGVR